MFVYSQSLHLYDVDEIPQYLLEEGEEGVVWHNAENSLCDSNVKVIDII